VESLFGGYAPPSSAYCRWVALGHLVEDNVDPSGVTQPFAMVPAIAALPAGLKRVLGVESVHYPAIMLPYTASSDATHGEARDPPVTAQVSGDVGEVRASGAAASGAGGLRAAIAADVAGELAAGRVDTPTPDKAAGGVRLRSLSRELQFQLWGLTLQATSDLLAHAGMRRLAWPPLRFGNRAINSLVHALCGGAELYELGRGARRLGEVTWSNVAWLGVWAGGVLLVGGWIAWTIALWASGMVRGLSARL